MTKVEKNMYVFLLVLDVLAVIVGMVAGPLEQTSMSIAASVSAIFISICLIVYGIYFWIGKKKQK